MSDHPVRVANLKPKDLALCVTSMRYDALAEFLRELSAALQADAEADYERKRAKLSGYLDDAAHQTKEAAGAIYAAWTICEPRMKEK